MNNVQVNKNIHKIKVRKENKIISKKRVCCHGGSRVFLWKRLRRIRRKRAIFVLRESSAGVTGVGVSSVGGGGVALEPSSFSPVVSAAAIAVLIGVGEGALVVGVAVVKSVTGVDGVLALVVGVAGAAAETMSSGAKNFSVVPWFSSKWSRAHCRLCLSVSTDVPVRAFLVMRFLTLRCGGGGGGIALKRALCACVTYIFFGAG